jgi:hypothetical protein
MPTDARVISGLKRRFKTFKRETYALLNTDGRSTTPMESKFGGAPYLDAGEAWPQCPTCGGPFAFVAQVDLGTIPEAIRDRFGRGMLQVFYCRHCDSLADGSAERLVRVVPNVHELSPDQYPPVPDGSRTFMEMRVSGWRKPQPDYPRKEDGDPAWKAIADSLTEPEREALSEINVAGHAGIVIRGIKIGGWPSWLQEARYPPCPRCSQRMDVLVLQIDSALGAMSPLRDAAGSETVFEFGEAGVAMVLQCPDHRESLALVIDSL